MELFIIIASLLCMATAMPHSDICRDISKGIQRPDADIEQINECNECDEHTIKLPSEMSKWCPMDTDGIKEIELGKTAKVSDIRIRGEINTGAVIISYKDFEGNFQPTNGENEEPKAFEDNTDPDEEKKLKFAVPVETSVIKIQLLMSEDLQACVKVHVTGCTTKSQLSAPSMETMSDEGGPIMQADMWQWLLELFCVKHPWLTCPNKCVVYKKNVFGCQTCECRTPLKDEIYEGDIALTEQTFQELEEVLGVRSALADPGIQNGASSVVPKWTDYKNNGFYEVPYIDITGSSRAKAAINQAISELSQKTCIRLREKNANDRYHIEFFRGGGCFSPVGKHSSKNTVSIGRGCEYKGIVVHEILHSLGFWHEQSRPDRDRYVRIIFDNIKSGVAYNFRKQKASDINSFGSKYDTGSLMHYGGYAFSANGQPTIVDRSTNRAVQHQRNGLSVEDAKQINAMYPGCRTNPTATTTTPAPTPAPNCRDRASNCRNHVSNCRNWNVMKIYCKRSCNIC